MSVYFRALQSESGKDFSAVQTKVGFTKGYKRNSRIGKKTIKHLMKIGASG